jgi:hypothetical protein
VRIFVIFMMALGFFSIPPSLVMARELVYAPLPIETQATVVGSHAPMIPGRNGFSPVTDTDFDQFVRSMDGGL